MGMHNAISMLNSRIKILLKFLEATKQGQIPKDHGVLRNLACLCNQLPAIDSKEFSQEFISVFRLCSFSYLTGIQRCFVDYLLGDDDEGIECHQ